MRVKAIASLLDGKCQIAQRSVPPVRIDASFLALRSIEFTAIIAARKNARSLLPIRADIVISLPALLPPRPFPNPAVQSCQSVAHR